MEKNITFILEYNIYMYIKTAYRVFTSQARYISLVFFSSHFMTSPQ